MGGPSVSSPAPPPRGPASWWLPCCCRSLRRLLVAALLAAGLATNFRYLLEQGLAPSRLPGGGRAPLAASPGLPRRPPPAKRLRASAATAPTPDPRKIERQKKERLEKEQRNKREQEEERKRLEKERPERERQEKREREKQEREEKQEQERQEKERQEKEEKEKQEKEKQDREKQEKEKQEKEEQEKEKQEKEKQEKEKQEQEKQEKEKQEKEKQEKEKQEKERLEKEEKDKQERVRQDEEKRKQEEKKKEEEKQEKEEEKQKQEDEKRKVQTEEAASGASATGDASGAPGSASAKEGGAGGGDGGPGAEDRAVEWLRGGGGGDGEDDEDVPEVEDFYSASWFMSVSTFLESDPSPQNIATLEDGVFGVVRDRHHLLRMSLDYLDLAVEHLSGWWRRVGVPVNDAGYNYTVAKLSGYVRSHRPELKDKEGAPRGALRPTVAVVAFSQVALDADDERVADRDREIATLALAATVASVARTGAGRVVVAGSDPEKDGPVVREAFRRLAGEGGDGDGVITQVGGTELVFAPLTAEMCRTELEPNNVPRGTLAGLHLALLHHHNRSESSGGDGDGGDADADAWTKRWLGDDPSYWKYVYYSEADTILQTRRSVSKDMAERMDEGLVLAPSRLQPVAYDGDVPEFSRHHAPNENRGDYRLVPKDFKTPIVLNSGELVSKTAGTAELPYQHCCDEQRGDYKPGKADGVRCEDGRWWYECGFDKAGNHSRLEPYEFIRLSRGTGIASLASLEHGRRCVPSRVPCQRRKNEDAATSR